MREKSRSRSRDYNSGRHRQTLKRSRSRDSGRHRQTLKRSRSRDSGRHRKSQKRSRSRDNGRHRKSQKRSRSRDSGRHRHSLKRSRSRENTSSQSRKRSRSRDKRNSQSQKRSRSRDSGRHRHSLKRSRSRENRSSQSRKRSRSRDKRSRSRDKRSSQSRKRSRSRDSGRHRHSLKRSRSPENRSSQSRKRSSSRDKRNSQSQKRSRSRVNRSSLSQKRSMSGDKRNSQSQKRSRSRDSGRHRQSKERVNTSRFSDKDLTDESNAFPQEKDTASQKPASVGTLVQNSAVIQPSQSKETSNSNTMNTEEDLMNKVGGQIISSENYLRCDMCNVFSTSHVMHATHLQSKMHKKELVKFNREFECKVCDLALYTQETLDAHLAGKPHLKKFKQKQIADRKTAFLNKQTKSFPIAMVAKKWTDFLFKCEVCQIGVNSLEALDTHLAGTLHFKNSDPRIPSPMEGEGEDSWSSQKQVDHSEDR